MRVLFCIIILLSCLFNYGQINVVLPDARDKQNYQTIVIGKQTWMAENLRYNFKSGSWCYANKKLNCSIYGRLYTWSAAMQSCPKGWRLPDEKEWEELEQFLGLTKKEIKERGWRGKDQGDRLREGGNTGFNAKFSGFRFTNGKYFEIDHGTGFWTATPGKDGDAFRRFINIENKGIDKDKEDMGSGFSVRCIQGEK